MSKQVFWYPNAQGSYDENGIPSDEYALEEPTNPWDKVSLGPYTLPGLVKVKVNRERKLDIKKSPGTHGATITDQGYNPAEVEINQMIWRPSELAKMQDIMPTLEPAPSKKDAFPLDIIHPATAIRGIKTVYVQRIDGPEDGNIPGSKVFVYKCVEWYPKPVNATKTQKKSLQNFDNAIVPGRESTPIGPPSQASNDFVGPPVLPPE